MAGKESLCVFSIDSTIVGPTTHQQHHNIFKKQFLSEVGWTQGACVQSKSSEEVRKSSAGATRGGFSSLNQQEETKGENREDGIDASGSRFMLPVIIENESACGKSTTQNGPYYGSQTWQRLLLQGMWMMELWKSHHGIQVLMGEFLQGMEHSYP